MSDCGSRASASVGTYVTMVQVVALRLVSGDQGT